MREPMKFKPLISKKLLQVVWLVVTLLYVIGFTLYWWSSGEGIEEIWLLPLLWILGAAIFGVTFITAYAVDHGLAWIQNRLVERFGWSGQVAFLLLAVSGIYLLFQIAQLIPKPLAHP